MSTVKRTVAEALNVSVTQGKLHRNIKCLIDSSSLTNMEAVAVLEAVKFQILAQTVPV